MATAVHRLKTTVQQFLRQYFPEKQVERCILQPTDDAHEGEVTVVLFPVLSQISRIFPGGISGFLEEFQQTLNKAGFPLKRMELVRGFLNLQMSDTWWDGWIRRLLRGEESVYESVHSQSPGETWIVEFSSPNTNKPLHLGHVRNNTLGDALSRLFATVYPVRVIRINLINDRGIHICKSMLAWMKWGEGKTPRDVGVKGDHFVGDFYVRFEQEYRKQVDALIRQGISEEEAQEQAPLMREARELLRRWEAGDPEVLKIWEMMNQWVLEGFRQTYERFGVSFDEWQFESQTYRLGKQMVEEGLRQGIFYRAEDGSVWVDLTAENLGRKLLLRKDGTSVYITQDLGTIEQRWQKYRMERAIYVVADEQNYHFQVLKAILRRMGKPYADAVYHLAYAMVELPEGKMKSREGTVIDADEFLDELKEMALQQLKATGKGEEIPEKEREDLAEKIALTAIKFYMLRVDPSKKILFRREEALDFEGYSGPFLQYTHVRIRSLARRDSTPLEEYLDEQIHPLKEGIWSERECRLLKRLFFYPVVVEEAARRMDPSLIANAIYGLAKEFNRYYARVPIVRERDASLRGARRRLAEAVDRVLQHACELLNLPLVEQM